MKIKTRFLGEVEIDEKMIMDFPEGIPGFEDSRRYVLLDIPENDVFRILQNADDEHISFIVTDPWVFFEDYDFDIPDEELAKINIKKEEQLSVMNIVTLSDEFENSTVNLLAPVVVNKDDRAGKQYVLNSGKYTTKHPLFTKAEGEANACS
ncbi:MAG: flagellar assembly protein FliW [Firmicutes bacterium]|nr:flagellar assembly protein FliW [Bacillota bacterium]